jgi:hypothetical protein
VVQLDFIDYVQQGPFRVVLRIEQRDGTSGSARLSCRALGLRRPNCPHGRVRRQQANPRRRIARNYDSHSVGVVAHRQCIIERRQLVGRA